MGTIKSTRTAPTGWTWVWVLRSSVKSRLLGYSINVSSRVGEGTRVHLRVPQHIVSYAAGAPTKEPDLVPVSDEHARCRLALLEDNDSVRTVIELFLTLVSAYS